MKKLSFSVRACVHVCINVDKSQSMHSIQFINIEIGNFGKHAINAYEGEKFKVLLWYGWILENLLTICCVRVRVCLCTSMSGVYLLMGLFRKWRCYHKPNGLYVYYVTKGKYFLECWKCWVERYVGLSACAWAQICTIHRLC